jgi:hypothetical protein
MVKRWVRFVMPIMVEVDSEHDEVLRMVTLPEEIREDRDDRGHFLIYDEFLAVRLTGTFRSDVPHGPGILALIGP